MFTNFLCNSFILSLLVLSAHCPHCITRGWCARLGCSMTTETRRETDSGPEPRPRWLQLRHGVLNMSYITDMKQNDWQVITQPRWMTETRNFDVYCKAAWRMIWRLRGCEVCQNYYPSFLSKILPRRAVSSLFPALKCIKETQTELGNKFDFWFQFYHVWTGEALILNKLFIFSLFSLEWIQSNVLYSYFLLIAFNKIWWKYESFECVEGWGGWQESQVPWEPVDLVRPGLLT